MPRFKITVISSVPFTRTGGLRDSIEVEADSIEEAKVIGEIRIATRNGKSHPMPCISVEVEQLD